MAAVKGEPARMARLPMVVAFIVLYRSVSYFRGEYADSSAARDYLGDATDE